MTLISLSNVGMEFGASRIFRDVTLTVGDGDRWGILGRNGTGKTTLFRIMLGEQQPTEGAVARRPNTRMAVLDQHRDFGNVTTVWEAGAGEFAHLLALEKSLGEQADALAHATEATMDKVLARYDRDLERFEREGGYTFAPKVDAILEGLGFDAAKARTQPLEHLSGGERGRLGLARQLASSADMLLLDEPTNHLDLETTKWLEDYLITSNKTIVVISHDRAFLANVVDHVLHFEAGSAFAYTGSYESFVQQREERRLTQQRAYEKQAKVIADKEDYIRRNLAGQNTRQAKGKRKILARTPRLSPPPGAEGSMALSLEFTERGGDQVVVAKDVAVAVDDRTLIEKFTATIQRNEVVGLIGPNGSGKSTFLRSLVGDREPARGELRMGASTISAYYRQDMAQVPTDRTLYDIIHDLKPAWERRMVQGHLGRFGFSGDEAQRRADTLSGGERARAALAMMVLSRANFLLLDEPTNHLDVESIEALEDALQAYQGTILLVSHDRALLRALTTRVWVLHERHVTDFPGSFLEWEEVTQEREHAAAVAAQEEESLRRVHEKQATRRNQQQSSKGKDNKYAAKQKADAAEKRVEELEAKVAAITHQLEDPELYIRSDGAARAVALGKDLDKLRRQLDAAIEEWTKMTEAVDSR
jgi:ATP-binding cassette, subfamily F, member 3